MLKEAALNTLKINRIAMEHGMMLKDASAYNMQWYNGNMVLIDTCSFMRYEPGMPWGAYRQFLQHFLCPLLLMSYRNASFGKMSQVYLDGIPVRLAAALLPMKAHLKPSLLAHIYAQSLNLTVSNKRKVNMSRMAFDALLNNLFNLIYLLEYKPKSTKTDYMNGDSYNQQALDSKKLQVARCLDHMNDNMTFADLGCNTGDYDDFMNLSVDIDHDCVESVYKYKWGTLPLVIDLCNPSPAIGWANIERRSFWDRVNVDTIMALALIHHLCVANNVPLAKVAELLAGHCKKLIIEFVPLEDPKAKLLLGSKNIPPYSLEIFKSAFGKYFNILQEYPIEESLRTIYLMEKR
jgi:hypothetical protein